jgi:biotin carboxyl carrier protein
MWRNQGELLLLTRRLQKWFSRRFVVISEILGYTLSAIVGLGVLYTVFVDTEVLARVQGEIQPSSVAMKADTEVLLFEYIVKSGDSVKQGQPVLRVVADQASQQRIHARRLLETAVAALEIGSGADSSASLEAARHALAVLPTGKDQVETLTSPSDGFFFVPTESGQGDAISKGKNLALIYDLTQLSMDLSRSVSP